MSLLAKIGALLRRCQFAQSRCQQALAQLTRQDDGLQRELRALEAQGQGMRQLLQAQQLAGAVVDRGQLFALQRRQAVLRQQLQGLALQGEQLQEQRQQLQQERERQSGLSRQWLRKEDKYQRWAQRVRKQRRLVRLRQEEGELEERTKWKP
ncbi:hypothetical protein ABH309_15860 [Chromobacterium piscinae]|uniref:Type III secretion system protein SpaM n=1 Tax=Chromobacterium piscinae TaxID=686831 RepID=A0ABV0H780_9NEIS|nr:hypothetical protein [Chromobacterium vaccinii]MBX9355818.1 hypothetical protein [Chromobacterium vaccinii]